MRRCREAASSRFRMPVISRSSISLAEFVEALVEFMTETKASHVDVGDLRKRLLAGASAPAAQAG